jgi:hypothetical protein
MRNFLDNLWRWKCELPEKDDKPERVADYDTLNRTQYPEEFKEIHQLAHNRMIMGAFRYGDINRQDLDNYDVAPNIIIRTQRYIDDGNLEHLVDAYNMVRIEYFKARRAGKQLISIDDGEHAKPK